MNNSNSMAINVFLRDVGAVLLFTGFFWAWEFQSANLLPKFMDIGLMLIIATSCLYYSIKNKSACNVKLDVYLFLVNFYFAVVILMSLYYEDWKNLVWIMFGVFIYYVMNFHSTFCRDGIYSISKTYLIFSVITCSMYFLSNMDVLSLNNIGLERVSIGEDNEAYGLVAYGSVFALAGFASYKIKSQTIYFTIFEFFSVAMLVLLIFMTGARSAIVGMFFCLFLWGGRKVINPIYTVVLVILFVCLFMLIADSLSERFEHTIDFVKNGALTFINQNDSISYDSSAASRVSQRIISLNLLFENPLLGAGFKNFWVDFPLLQSFSDLGILFGFFYVMLYFILPLKFSLENFRKDNFSAFLSVVYISNCPRLFLHGQPYDWAHMVYVFPVLAIMSTKSTSS